MELKKQGRSDQPSLSVIHENEGRVNWKYLSNARKKPTGNKALHRDGPAPKKGKTSGVRCSIGALDSDVEDLDEKEEEVLAGAGIATSKRSVAGSKALIIYFAKLARAVDTELVDYKFVESLITGGADINFADKHGQTILHEVARNWNTDVAYYLIKNGSDINKADKWGRTPLHLAAAVDHADMVQFLIQNGADCNAKTTGELQSPIHYAAKYNAVKALKVLLESHTNVGDRDYKGRTPLFVAAEAAREDAVRFLVEKGVPVGVFSESGISALALMIEKMPDVAMDALQQFMIVDRAFRKEYYYLNYLDADPSTWREIYEREEMERNELKLHDREIKKKNKKKQRRCPQSPLKIAVQCEELNILMHPVMQQLIQVKWRQFGKWASILGAGFHFTYIMIWTWLAIFLPRDGVFYSPLSKNWWRILFEFLGCIMTLYFIIKQVWEIKTTRADRHHSRSFKIQDIYRDMEYCHPKWPDEKTFLESELREIQTTTYNYFKDPWNIMDCLTYVAVLTVIVTRLMSVLSANRTAVLLHPRAYTIALILLWVHFMKSCRPFTSLGPFIIMLGYVMQDTLRFAFLFFEFFIPYVCAFWILFGGPSNAAVMESGGAESVDWAKFNDLTFSVWQVTLIADFNIDGLFAVDRVMAQILLGTYFAVASTVCINLFIALLSETFSRVYQNAKANAALLQATTILQAEKALTKEQRRKVRNYVQLECAPLEIYQNGDHDPDSSNSPFIKLIRRLKDRLDTFDEFCKALTPNFSTSSSYHVDGKPGSSPGPSSGPASGSTFGGRSGNLLKRAKQNEADLFKMRQEIFDLKCFVLKQLGESIPLMSPIYEDLSEGESYVGNIPNSRPDSQRESDSEPQDWARKLLDRKLQQMNQGSRGPGRRRRRGRKNKGMPPELSGSWETITTVEGSVC